MQLLIRLGAIAFGLLIVLIVGSKIYTRSQSDTLYETAVRYAAQDTQVEGYKLFFLQINRKDPSPEFLQRFQGAPFTIRAGSQGIEDTSFFSGRKAKDKNTGEVGKMLKFGDINWVNPSHPIVRAGGDMYVMKKEGGTWQVDYHGIIGG